MSTENEIDSSGIELSVNEVLDNSASKIANDFIEFVQSEINSDISNTSSKYFKALNGFVFKKDKSTQNKNSDEIKKEEMNILVEISFI